MLRMLRLGGQSPASRSRDVYARQHSGRALVPGQTPIDFNNHMRFEHEHVNLGPTTSIVRTAASFEQRRIERGRGVRFVIIAEENLLRDARDCVSQPEHAIERNAQGENLRPQRVGVAE